MYLTLELWNIVPHSTSRNRRLYFVRPASIVSLTLGPARNPTSAPALKTSDPLPCPRSLTSHH